MQEWLKSVFAKHYIGAIVIALLSASGFENVFGAISMPINMMINMSNTRSVISPSVWTYAIPNLVRAVLCFAAAFTLALWLYGKPQSRHKEEVGEPLS